MGAELSKLSPEFDLAALTFDDDGVKQEIQTQVGAGFVVTVHRDELVYAGWRGVGYTVVDPQTGSGAYKISGGSDGNEVVNGSGNDFVSGMLMSSASIDDLDKASKANTAASLIISILHCANLKGTDFIFSSILVAAIVVIAAILSFFVFQ